MKKILYWTQIVLCFIVAWPIILIVWWFDTEHLNQMKDNLSPADYELYRMQYTSILDMVHEGKLW